MQDNPFLNNLNLPWQALAMMVAIMLFGLSGKLIPKKRHRWRQKAAKRVLAKLQEVEGLPQKIAYLRNIDAFIFEELVLEAFERRGCRVKRNKRYTGDGGIDGKFWIKKQLYLVQAKRYSNHISAAHVREFVTLCDQHKSKGIFVHTGRTGRLSKEIADQCPDVTIISGKRLIQLITPNKTIEKEGVEVGGATVDPLERQVS